MGELNYTICRNCYHLLDKELSCPYHRTQLKFMGNNTTFLHWAKNYYCEKMKGKLQVQT